MNKLLIIHPYDVTTLFLRPITDSLSSSFYDVIEIVKVNPTQQDHSDVFFKLSTLPSGSTVAFLGHGSSDCIYSAADSDFKAYPFINEHNINVFDNVNLLCFSCRSADFLRKTFSKNKILASIGFDDIPTSFQEVIDARETDSTEYVNFTESTIEVFNLELVTIMSKTLESFLKYDLSFIGLFDFLTLYINQSIYNRLIDLSRPDNLAIANQLKLLKRNMKFFIS